MSGYTAAAALAMAAVGTAVSAYGAIQQGQAAKASANYNAQIAENNRIIAEQNREYALRAGAAKAEQESLKGRVALGKIKAAQAASGVSGESESFGDVQVGAREANVLDVQNVLQRAQLEAYGFESQAANFEAESNLSRLEGANAAKAGKIGALGTLLSGAGGLGGQYATFKNAGMISGAGGLGG